MTDMKAGRLAVWAAEGTNRDGDASTLNGAAAMQAQPDERDRPDLGILPEFLGYQLRRAQSLVSRDFQAATGDIGLTPGQFHVLMLVANNPDITQTAVAQEAGIDRSTLVPLLDKLEAKGWILRRPSPADRRANGLVLTDDGERMLSDLIPRLKETDRRTTEMLSDGERRSLVVLLQRIIGS